LHDGVSGTWRGCAPNSDALHHKRVVPGAGEQGPRPGRDVGAEYQRQFVTIEES